VLAFVGTAKNIGGGALSACKGERGLTAKHLTQYRWGKSPVQGLMGPCRMEKK
jgi:hypothetical protein